MNNSDQRIWHNSNPDTLSLKESYFFKNRITDRLSWANHILSVDTPPSKLLVVWRLMHDKLPTDDQLQRFTIPIHPPRALTLTQVIWCSPSRDCIKCNVDGAHSSNLFAEFSGVLRALVSANAKGW
ncbi:unnamed protein product [Vicia faba]|uniref:Reverse transcriptase zinc-binding domain-containing protein n=1 Tax=Vicia faba TaxID=3906 RepID=A0AAV0YZT2_VICFA|nr:unnamed protein product [Vicia faba]